MLTPVLSASRFLFPNIQDVFTLMVLNTKRNVIAAGHGHSLPPLPF